jgi:hypothetical protein
MEKTDMKNKGLFGKYIIKKADGSPIDKGAEYFVLRLNGDGDINHIEACKKAVLVYAEQIKDHLPLLSQDLIAKYGKVEETKETESLEKLYTRDDMYEMWQAGCSCASSYEHGIVNKADDFKNAISRIK